MCIRDRSYYEKRSGNKPGKAKKEAEISGNRDRKRGKGIANCKKGDFIASLPKEMDPNGENGEYHTSCYDGPIFSSPVLFRLGTPFSQSYDIRLEDGTIHLLLNRQ